jgi:hypothetical protein
MTDPRDLERIDQEIRINELREAVAEVTGEDFVSYENPDSPPEIVEQFWQNVLAFETAEESTEFERLVAAGLDLPPSEELDDAAVTAKLWEVIHAMAARNSFISTTNHLSDRELYEYLWNDGLREFSPDFPVGSGWNHHLDLLSSGSDEDTFQYLKYYADEEYRAQYAQDWPDDPMPAHVDPPYDRDRRLPQAERPGERGAL